MNNCLHLSSKYNHLKNYPSKVINNIIYDFHFFILELSTKSKEKNY